MKFGFGLLKGGGRKASRTVSIDATLGNVMIAGNSKRGTEVVINNYAIDSLNRGYGLVIFRDIINGVSAYPNIAPSNTLVYGVDCSENGMTEQIDPFAGMNDSEVNQYIIKLFDMYNEFDKSKKMSFQNYIALLRNLASKAGKKVRLNTLNDIPIEDVEDWNIRYCTGTEQSRNDRFLSSMRGTVIEIESYFSEFASNVAGYILSGTRSLEQFFRVKPVLEISLDCAKKAEESALIMTAVIDALARYKGAGAKVSRINVVVDGVPNDIINNSGLQKLIKGSANINVIFNVQDISSLVKECNEWIDYSDSFFFFKQNSNENKEYCSQLFGEQDVKKTTRTSGTNTPSFWGRLSGQTSSSNSGTTEMYVHERIYKPEEFSDLGENEAIYYFKNLNEYSKLNVY